MSHRELGKIEAVHFGYGGYQDAMIGVRFSLGGDGWGTNDFWGCWSFERSELAIWTEAERLEKFGEIVMRINALLKTAKVNSLDELKNKPIEAVFDSPIGKLLSWRILTEVL